MPLHLFSGVPSYKAIITRLSIPFGAMSLSKTLGYLYLQSCNTERHKHARIDIRDYEQSHAP